MRRGYLSKVKKDLTNYTNGSVWGHTLPKGVNDFVEGEMKENPVLDQFKEHNNYLRAQLKDYLNIVLNLPKKPPTTPPLAGAIPVKTPKRP
jgi:hypothetical protein